MLPFKDDFKKKLMQFGRLPISSLDKKFAITAKAEKYKEVAGLVDGGKKYSKEKQKKIRNIDPNFLRSEQHKLLGQSSATTPIDPSDKRQRARGGTRTAPLEGHPSESNPHHARRTLGEPAD